MQNLVTHPTVKGLEAPQTTYIALFSSATLRGDPKLRVEVENGSKHLST